MSACITTSPLPSFSLRDVGTTSSPTLCQGLAVAPHHQTSGSKQGMCMGGSVGFTKQGGPYIHHLVHTNILARAWPGLRCPKFGLRMLTSPQTSHDFPFVLTDGSGLENKS